MKEKEDVDEYINKEESRKEIEKKRNATLKMNKNLERICEKVMNKTFSCRAPFDIHSFIQNPILYINHVLQFNWNNMNNIWYQDHSELSHICRKPGIYNRT
jgi:hypothetical protein